MLSFARALLLAALPATLFAQQAPYLNPALPPEQRAADLVSRMTLAEKVSQMQNHAVAIPRLGVPAYDWWSEALHGVARSGYATVFPQAIGMAATWDTNLVHQEGQTIAREGRAHYNAVGRDKDHDIYYGLDFWSPNINIFRDPRWGRGQETYGEDPFLTGRMGVNFARGVQGDDPKYYAAISTPKHYAVHSGPESERHRFNVDPSPHDLEDTYLPAFRAAITEAKAGSIMCAYNAVDGVPACANANLLNTRLREDWHFNGYVTSDCGAVGNISETNGHHYAPDLAHAAALAVKAGTDVDCGDEYQHLNEAVAQNLITEAEINRSVERLFTARFKLGLPPGPAAEAAPFANIPESEINSPANAALALRAAHESMVLLKNDGALPLKSATRTLAVIGPNAASMTALEGNYNGTPRNPITPYAALRKRYRVIAAQGAPYAEQLSLPVPPEAFHTTADGGEEGLRMELFNNAEFAAQAVKSTVPNIDFDWSGAIPPGLTSHDFSARWTGTFTPPAAGDYTFDLALPDCYPCSDSLHLRVSFDGRQSYDASYSPEVARERHSKPFTVHFDDTRPHAFQMEFAHGASPRGAAVALNWKPPVAALREQAVAAAKQADAVVAFVGLTANLEGEEMPIDVPGFRGGDRTDIALPAAQRQMLEAVAATGKPLIVVLMNGSALAVDWAQQHANAILEAWYPGESGGQAIADTLAGTNNPSGRLPVTFYASTDQLPPFEDYSMAKRTYRYFPGKPLYGFGYGLSYANFAYSAKQQEPQTLAAESLDEHQGGSVTVTVSNKAGRDGDDVVELYIQPPSGVAGAPLRQLAGFRRVHLRAGTSEPVTVTFGARELSTVDAAGHRSVQPGAYTLYMGGSQPGELPGGVMQKLTVTGTKRLAP